jgi:phosphate transport system protein
MTRPSRSILDRELTQLRDHTIQLVSMVDAAIGDAMEALVQRNVALAQQVVAHDRHINNLRYTIEEESVRLIATQQPAAGDLRLVIATIHMAVELERMGDHAAGIAELVGRMEEEAGIDSLHQLPKMARRARQMVQECLDAYVSRSAHLAQAIIGRDDKLDRQYRKLFEETVAEMRDDSYIRRATYLLWAGHNLERIGDRATNIAERIIYMVTGRFALDATGEQIVDN